MNKNLVIFLFCASIFKTSDIKTMKRTINLKEEENIQLLLEEAKKNIYKKFSHAQWANVDHDEKFLREQQELLANAEKQLEKMKEIERDFAQYLEKQNISLLIKTAKKDLQ